MLLVSALYMAHALLLKIAGRGLDLPWLATLILPGLLAAHLSHKSPASHDPARDGAVAGLLAAHFAALLQVIVLVIGVLNIDWPAYVAQVGPDIGNGVHSMALPATAVASLVLIAVTYTGCIMSGWLGALAYTAIMDYRNRTHNSHKG
jgi:hypothetical protein